MRQRRFNACSGGALRISNNRGGGRGKIPDRGSENGVGIVPSLDAQFTRRIGDICPSWGRRASSHRSPCRRTAAGLRCIHVANHTDRIALVVVPDVPGINPGIRIATPEHAAEPSPRLAETAEVEQSRIETAGRPGPRFAEVVRAGPDELAEDELLVARDIPGVNVGRFSLP